MRSDGDDVLARVFASCSALTGSFLLGHQAAPSDLDHPAQNTHAYATPDSMVALDYFCLVVFFF
jgi:hypothetical protein